MWIQFSGPDSPGWLANLTARLAVLGVVIQDIRHAAVHGTAALGVCLELPGDGDAQALPQAIAEEAARLGIAVGFGGEVFAADAAGNGNVAPSRFVITVMGRAIHAAHLARVTEILAENGFAIDRIETLSERLHPASESSGANACAQLSASGPGTGFAHGADPVRTELLAAAEEMGIDLVCERESIFRRNRRLFVFDMDSTLISGEVIDELAKLAGVGDRVVAITEAAMRGEFEFQESFRRRVGLLKGLEEHRVYELLGRIPLVDGAERLLKTLKALGCKTAILSGGFTFFARHLQQRLGIDWVHANELEFADGRVTGRVTGQIVDGARKAALLAEIAALEGIRLEQVVAVGDGANDLPMLKLAGLGIAFRAKPVVRAGAEGALGRLGLDSLLYLIGVRDRDLAELIAE